MYAITSARTGTYARSSSPDLPGLVCLASSKAAQSSPPSPLAMAPLSRTELDSLPKEYAAAVDSIASRLPENLAAPKWGIICGSGLSGLVDHIEEKVVIDYDTIPVSASPPSMVSDCRPLTTSRRCQGFAASTVAGHKSSLAFGYLSSGPARVAVVAALGRFHLYEGHSAQTCVFPVRVMRCLGAEAVVVTNASGGLHPDWDVGTIVAMHDHLSLPTLGVSARSEKKACHAL